tara:strand:- start:112 stop:663 length:552 start_codon:yes stop_codon:yes gene_type:complete
MFRATDIEHDIDAMRAAFERVDGLFDKRGQLGVTSRAGAETPLFDAVGWLPEGAKESDYSVINDEFQDTAIVELLAKLPFPYGRTRLMKMAPKSCLSVHADPTARYHYAIVTNPSCYLIEVDGSSGTFYHIPADGRLYHMEAFRTHTAINASNEARIHLVICAVDEERDVAVGRTTVTGAATG